MLRNLGGHPISGSILKKIISTYKVECLGQVYEGKIKWLVLFSALLLQLTERVYHVNSWPVRAEDTL